MAAHNANLEAAELSASADRDARFAARLKEQEAAEERRECEELNGGNPRARGTKARERSRTPPADRDEPIPPPPTLPQQPRTGSATTVPIAVVVRTKSAKSAKHAAKKARKADKKAAK